MADYGLVLAWGTPVRGREQKALEVFLEGQDMYGKAQANGEIFEFETVLMQGTAGGLPGGHTIAWGTEDQVDAFARSEPYQRLVMRATLIVEDLGSTRCIRGEALTEGMGQYGEAISELT